MNSTLVEENLRSPADRCINSELLDASAKASNITSFHERNFRERSDPNL